MLIIPTEFAEIWAEVEKQMFPSALSLRTTLIESSPDGIEFPSLYQVYSEYFADNPHRTMLIHRTVKGVFDNIPYDEEDALSPELAEAYPTRNLQAAPPLSPYVASIWKMVPPLFVKVQKLRKGVFEPTAVYRGPAFFQLANYSYLKIGSFHTEDELIDAYEKMNAAEGMDVDAMKRFQQRIYERSCSLIGKPKPALAKQWTN